MNYTGITLIYTHIDVEGEQSFELIPGHTFRRANSEETIKIKELLEEYNNTPIPGWRFPYEYVTKEIKHGASTKYEREHLPEEEWKYWVIAFDQSNREIHKLQYAAILLEHELDMAFEVLFFEGGGIGHSSIPSRLRDRVELAIDTNTNAQKIHSDEIKLISKYYKKQEDVSKSYPFIDHAIKNLFALRAIPSHSELIIVGYFSIIESLITHSPRLTETLDSIRHQIYNKMILLRKKFKRKIEYSSYFLHAKEDNIWKTLYDYRSCLAHGSVPNFNSKFQILKNHKNVSNFLKENIKEIIVIAMEESEFIEDLKKC